MGSLKPDGEQQRQVKELRKIFRRFDMDSDGSLTELEVAALLRSIGMKKGGDDLHAMVAAMDENGNGAVEFEELMKAVMPAELVSHEHVMQLFRRFDRDSSGFITPAELAGSMARLGRPLTYKELSDMIAEADTDGDGLLSFPEFAAVLSRSSPSFLSFPSSKSN